MEKDKFITVTLWHFLEDGKAIRPISFKDERVVLFDHQYDQLIQRFFQAFEPLRLTGLIMAKSPEVDDHINQCIKSGDFTHLEPALVTQRFGGRFWQDVTVEDGAFMLNNSPWVSVPQWTSFLPYMTEFLLRAEQLSDRVFGEKVFFFIIYFFLLSFFLFS